MECSIGVHHEAVRTRFREGLPEDRSSWYVEARFLPWDSGEGK